MTMESSYISAIRAKVGNDLLLLPGASALVRNAAGEILLQQRLDNGRWGLPGGMIEPGEEPAAAAIRETWEETGLVIAPEEILGVYGGERLMGQYANGDHYAYIIICFICRVVGGELFPDCAGHEETRALRWFAPEAGALPEAMVETHRQRILQYLEGRRGVFAM